ncbi:AAA family ATPase [Serratia marcescens]|uniref:AAA family ATPase n=1 Tax=Serratia marcescens TaxID=615 RepID=UPI004057D73B
MKINVKNLGFIKNGDFDTNDLTIIFGKNNSGKTYLSYTTYIISKELKDNMTILCNLGDSVTKALEESDDDITLKVSTAELLNPKNLSTINTLLRVGLSKEFNVEEEYFSKTRITLDFDSLVKKAMSSSFDIVMSSKFLDRNVFISKQKNIDDITISVIKTGVDSAHIKLPESGRKSISNYFYKYQIRAAIIDQIVDLDMSTPFVITSERTGIEMFYKEMDNNRSDITEEITVKKITKRKKIEYIDSFPDHRISTYSKPIADNIRTIRNQQEIRKNKSYLLQDKEHENVIKSLRKMTKGNFSSTKSGETIFLMDNSNVKIPIHAASSSIKSMLLMDLYINNLAKRGETLIIDEPELNLHPDNQILMAELLVRLVNAGIKVMITTHSDYLVREINNRIKLSNADTENALYSKMIDGIYDTIDHSRVNAFNINSSGVIEKIEISKSGMDSVIFDEVIIDSAEREELILSLLKDEL